MSFSLYGLLIGLSFVVFWWLWEKRLQTIEPKLSNSQLNTAVLLLALGALIGARLYHVATDWSLYANNPMAALAIWQGGLGFYGAIGGGWLGLIIWHRITTTNRSWLQLLDAAALAVPWSQALGRWGNFINQELFGPPTNLPWGITIDPAHRPPQWSENTTFHPLFLYESLILLMVGFFLWLIYLKFRHLIPLGSGFYTGSYLVAYGTIRFSLEFLRWQSTPGWGPLTIAQWVSLGLIGIGLLLLPRAFRLQ